MPEATGQDKPEENGEANVLQLQGADFLEIEELYNRSQEKYLDLGHLEVLVLGEDMVNDERWKSFIEYLKEQPFIGENIYIFRTENPEALVGWKNERGTSLGEYVTGILENRTKGQQEKGVTLRELYYQISKDGTLPEVPTIVMEQEELEIFWV